MRAALAAIAVAIVASAGSTAVAAGPPAVTAPSAIVVQPATGDVIFARKADQERAIASTTKLMTALVSLDRLSLGDVLSAVPYSPGPAESLAGLHTGERLTVADYLRALLIVSANDAAATLATRVAGTTGKFVTLMNARAHQLGLTHTHFETPVGLDVKGNHSTATDLVKLTLVLRQNAFFRQTTNTARTTIRSGDHPRVLVNRNTLVRTVPYVNGVKTGHTSRAGNVLVGSATRNGVTVVSAVLGDPTEATRNSDSLALLRYGLSRYHVITAVRKGQHFGDAKLRYRGDETVGLLAGQTVRRTVRRGEKTFTRVADAPAEVDGPLAQGARVGTIEVRLRGKTVARVPLVVDRPVSAATATQRLTDYLGRLTSILLLAVFVGGSLLLVLLRRRMTRRRSGAPQEA
ncbi:MAG: hypothetical protein QOJ63_175 [Solirubrobacteraceae bacterium]|jgi:D-alanyl-D-alanine carboxypeptidase (penicillin-binding protein 5/6)|nr:hypothetical protein [Solirubrobacteraceae bacterium]